MSATTETTMTTTARIGSALRAMFEQLRAFARGRKGVAAVEFAMILPLALALYAGASEVADAVNSSRDLNIVTRTLDDLVAQQPTSPQLTSLPMPANATSAATLSSLLTSATTLMGSAPTSSLSMTVSAIDVRNTALGICCSITVRWSYTQNGTLRPCNTFLTTTSAGAVNSPTTIPAQLAPFGTPLPQPLSLIVAETSYVYQPVFNAKILNFAPAMARIDITMPRATGQVITGALPTSGTQHGVVCY